MLRILEKKDEIENAQRQFEEAFDQVMDRRGKVLLGHRGGSWNVEIKYSTKLNLWWCFDEEEKKRYWCPFGTGEPHWKEKYSHSPVCEINSPLKGINRSTTVAFARDEKGRLFLVHRGNIRGGRKGVGKKAFFKNFRGGRVDVFDGGNYAEVALIGVLGAKRFVRQVADFVREVERIKSFIVEGKIDAPPLVFVPEPESRRGYELSARVEAECGHASVANALASQLEEMGFDVGNDRPRDLYIGNTRSPDYVFEIKTSTSTSDCYSAIGQLFFHSTILSRKPRLVAVFPSVLPEEHKKIFKKLDIRCLTYNWRGDAPVFNSLNLIVGEKKR